MSKPTRLKGPGARHISPGLQAPALTRTAVLNALGPLVYAASTRDGLVKIGFTAHLAQRVGEFGGMRAILAIRLGCTMSDEQAIHSALNANPANVARGIEWYHPTDEVLDVVNTMRADIGMPPIDCGDIAD